MTPTRAKALSTPQTKNARVTRRNAAIVKQAPDTEYDVVGIAGSPQSTTIPPSALVARHQRPTRPEPGILGGPKCLGSSGADPAIARSS